MPKILKIVLPLLFFTGLILAIAILTSGHNIALLNPKGIIALKQRNLIILAPLLMLIVVLPVYFMTFFFAWKYRAGNRDAKYTPEWNKNRILELTWWAFPAVVIFILAIITWKSTHELDPYKPLESNIKPLTIQVVSLQWKWLFIYPEQNIASINFIAFPQKTPINFELTSDAPMNSFWIPQLGGQIYAMEGMTTKTHLMADEIGEFDGLSAEISGHGFAGMKFIAKSVAQDDFDKWVQSVKQSSNTLNWDVYNQLIQASENNPQTFYSSVEKELYNSIIMKYTTPINDTASQLKYETKRMAH